MKLSILPNQLLIQAYNEAKKLNLDKSFIAMLKKEIEARNLSKKAEPSDA